MNLPKAKFPPGWPLIYEQGESKKKKILVILVLVFLSLALFGIYQFVSGNRYYQPPKAWVISQDLYQNIYRQNQLFKLSSGGAASVSDFINVSTSSALPQAKVEKVADSYFLTTGSVGEVVADLPYGIYKVKVVPIPGIDFTSVPTKININTAIEELRLGLAPGSGRVLASSEKKFHALPKNRSEGKTGKLVVHLYHDKNTNGKKDRGEESLKWAGVVISLSP